jgi:hypothetical protein
MTFIRGLRIWFYMFQSAQYLAKNWYPTYNDFKERRVQIYEENDDLE